MVTHASYIPKSRAVVRMWSICLGRYRSIFLPTISAQPHTFMAIVSRNKIVKVMLVIVSKRLHMFEACGRSCGWRQYSIEFNGLLFAGWRGGNIIKSNSFCYIWFSSRWLAVVRQQTSPMMSCGNVRVQSKKKHTHRRLATANDW